MIEDFRQLNLNQTALDNLARLGITTPTPVQAQAIGPLLDGRDLVGQAPTGSGKTLAYVLPMLGAIDRGRREPQALVLAPTRELAQQIAAVIAEVTRGLDLACVLIYGGVGYETQRKALAKGAQIAVGTPGRVLDLIGQGSLKLGTIRFMVLDEADRMFDEGFGPDVGKILEATPRARQTALFSATIPPWLERIAAKHLTEPVEIEISAVGEAELHIDHSVMVVSQFDKARALRWLLDRRAAGTALVFGRTKHGIERLRKSLASDGYPVRALQGNLSQPQRDKVLQWFRSDQGEILLATNIAARGLDVLSIGTVINYDLPESADMFTHRVGRTGRMGRGGESVTLMTGADLIGLDRIERSIGGKIKRVYWDDIGKQGAEGAAANGDRPQVAPDSLPSPNGENRSGTQLRVLPGERLTGSGREAQRNGSHAHASRSRGGSKAQPASR